MENTNNHFGRRDNESTVEWFERLIRIGAPLEAISLVRDILLFQVPGNNNIITFILSFVVFSRFTIVFHI